MIIRLPLRLSILLHRLLFNLSGQAGKVACQKAPAPGLFGFAAGEISIPVAKQESLGEYNRTRFENIATGANALNHLVIEPGQILSMEAVIGDPHHNPAYGQGPMVTPKGQGLSAGGGLCLISTALFNSALTAGLTIIEKHNHTLDLWGEKRFIPLGLDAAYVYSIKDLKILNRLDQSCMIRISFDREKTVLHCSIMFKHPRSVDHRVTASLLKTISPGPAGRQGFITLTERYSGHKRTYRKKEFYKPY